MKVLVFVYYVLLLFYNSICIFIQMIQYIKNLIEKNYYPLYKSIYIEGDSNVSYPYYWFNRQLIDKVVSLMIRIMITITLFKLITIFMEWYLQDMFYIFGILTVIYCIILTVSFEYWYYVDNNCDSLLHVIYLSCDFMIPISDSHFDLKLLSNVNILNFILYYSLSVVGAVIIRSIINPVFTSIAIGNLSVVRNTDTIANTGKRQIDYFNIINRIIISFVVLIRILTPKIYNDMSNHIFMILLTVLFVNIGAILSFARYYITQREIDAIYLNEKHIANQAYKMLIMYTNIVSILVLMF